ncbi:MAG: M1 family aminopeptidase [Pseudomonadota bacterium]
MLTPISSPQNSPQRSNASLSRTLASVLLPAAVSLALTAGAQAAEPKPAPDISRFEQLGQTLPTPNVYRTASGAPGHQYWQQRADYRIDATLDEAQRRVSANLRITYTNRSPDTLPYLWLQLDQNRFRRDSLEERSRTGSKADDGVSDELSFGELRRYYAKQDSDYGFNLTRLTDGSGRALDHAVVDTMLRVDLPRPLKPGAQQVLEIDWNFAILDEDAVGSRGGYEHFPDNDTYIYFLAQWFPRMAAYTDYVAWQHHQFLGRGEFTLEFGNYDVSLTVPRDHIVSASGELLNEREVLTAAQQRRLANARRADKPVFIVTREEALENEKKKTNATQTWRFRAENVRDFAWASSRKFIWDGMVHRQQGGEYDEVLAMSFYPNEAEPIWSQYSTQSVVHTMDVYSRFSFPYPYPTAQSVNTWKRGGMEYPMITFNGYRPTPYEEDEDKEKKDKGENRADRKGVDPALAAQDYSYSRSIKQRLIGVIIHEIGHIYFPMVVNSDERQWTWMDEGINSFLEYLASLEWEENYFAYEGDLSILAQISSYMTSANQVPIMTQSDSVLQFGPNAYTKPAAALVVLRETVLGRELFDFAFREYSRRWRFKRPTPADFFRTMEDASGRDLDWFWRGWFYSTDHVDVALKAIREYRINSGDPTVDLPAQRALDKAYTPEPIEQRRNRDAGIVPRLERVDGLGDFYNDNDVYTPSNEERNAYRAFLDDLEPSELKALRRAQAGKEYVYFVDFENEGGLLTPLPLAISYADGSVERLDIPAEIWRRNNDAVTKLLIRDKAITAIELDPDRQTADVDISDNRYPRQIQRSRLDLYKWPDDTRNLMKGMMAELKSDDEDQAKVPLQAQ